MDIIIVKTYTARCSGCDNKLVIPAEMPITTHKEARREAKRQDWVECAGGIDWVCPECVEDSHEGWNTQIS
jgi:hypothetical protein